VSHWLMMFALMQDELKEPEIMDTALLGIQD
jgi:hypothetical protein